MTDKISFGKVPARAALGIRGQHKEWRYPYLSLPVAGIDSPISLGDDRHLFHHRGVSARAAFGCARSFWYISGKCVFAVSLYHFAVPFVDHPHGLSLCRGPLLWAAECRW